MSLNPVDEILLSSASHNSPKRNVFSHLFLKYDDGITLEVIFVGHDVEGFKFIHSEISIIAEGRKGGVWDGCT